MAIRPENAVDKFITRWQSASGSERANYQLFDTLVAVGRERRRKDGLAVIA
jgi:hypothetical protein